MLSLRQAVSVSGFDVILGDEGWGGSIGGVAGCHRDLEDGCRSDTQDVRWKELGIYVGFGTECVFGMKETW